MNRTQWLCRLGCRALSEQRVHRQQAESEIQPSVKQQPRALHSFRGALTSKRRLSVQPSLQRRLRAVPREQKDLETLKSLEHSGETRQTRTQIPAQLHIAVTLDKAPSLSEPFYKVILVPRREGTEKALAARGGEQDADGTAQGQLCLLLTSCDSASPFSQT